jgi:hypothetical protein
MVGNTRGGKQMTQHIYQFDDEPYPAEEDEETKAQRLRRLHNAFAEDMEMLFKSLGRTIELPRLSDERHLQRV